jgi:hypothetical protein
MRLYKDREKECNASFHCDVSRRRMAEAQLSFLKFLTNASKQQVRFVLAHITTDQLNAVGEVCYNLLFGSANVSELKRHRHIIRTLGDKLVSIRRRKALVKQRPNLVVKLIRMVLP